MKNICLVITLLLLTSCLSKPEGIEPVQKFRLNKYLGTWYEIARLDHAFERGLEQVSARYRLRSDGGIDVINRGFDKDDHAWNEAKGRAYFVDQNDVGHLRVSFFRPFYSSYIIFNLDDANYQYAFVSGYNKNYLWLLARTPQVSSALKQKFILEAKAKGYNVDELIWVQQSSSLKAD
tara:strand:+ start:2032 stop:2565 length:534 start_codon:yes stop_codon:yes gene_type:complete